MTELSIIVPVYGAPQSLLELCERIDRTMQGASTSYEVLLVNDACPLGSWRVMKEICKKNRNIKGINLARNFGQHYAMLAGLDLAKGQYVAFMDCDLQDRPESLTDLLQSCKSGVDVSIAQSEYRGENNLIRKLSSKFFYLVFSYLNKNKDFNFNTSYIMMNKRVADAFRSMRENQRMFLSMLQYIGFSYAFVPVQHDSRKEGKSAYNFGKRLSLAFAGIVNSSTRLLKTGIVIGVLSASSAFIFGLYLIFVKIFFQTYVEGWVSTIVSTFFVGGVIMVLIGILGLYLEVVFWEVKRRPSYFISEVLNMEENTN